MAKARDLVRDYVLAGYTKIHLDCSMRLADDPGVAGGSAERRDGDGAHGRAGRGRRSGVARAARGAAAPLYVIGTEVPVPGGEQAARAQAQSSPPSRTRGARASLCELPSRTAGLQWRVGSGSSPWSCSPASSSATPSCSTTGARPRHSSCRGAVARLPRLVYEAHSTDYQTPAALRALVEDHFAVLKVGPALTFALREALFALAAIEDELLRSVSPRAGRGSAARTVREVVDRVMREHPRALAAYYAGDEAALRVARDFSYSDRIRYYWPQAEVRDGGRATHRQPLRPSHPAHPAQPVPARRGARRARRLAAGPAAPQELIRHKILTVLDDYANACGMRRPEPRYGRRWGMRPA